jgi:hypothetical protein
MTLDDLYPLYDADRGTLSTAGQRSFLQEVQAQGLSYAPYAQRVGPGCATAASELKRALDASVLPTRFTGEATPDAAVAESADMDQQ